MATDLKSTIVESIRGLVTEANEAATKVRAATSDRQSLVHDYLNPEGTAADDEIQKFIDWREAALAKIEETEAKIREHITATYLGEVDESAVDGLKTTYKEKSDQYKTAVKFFLGTIPGATEEDLKDLPALVTLRGGTSGGGNGGKRPRLSQVSYRTVGESTWNEVSKQTKNAKGEEVTVTNFTVLAAALKEQYGTKVEVKDLQAAAFEAAGTDDLSTLSGKPFEFVVSVGDNNVDVKVAPKAADDE